MKNAFVQKLKHTVESQKFKICNGTIVIILLGMLDSIICIPATCLIIVEKVSNETWTNENSILEVAVDIHMISTATFGLIVLGLMKCWIYMQTIVTVVTRLFSVAILYEIYQHDQINDLYRIMIWLVTIFTFVHILMECLTAKLRKSCKTNTSKCRMFLNTIIPAIFTTSIGTVIAYYTQMNTEFCLYYYIIYTSGFELLVSASYFVAIMKMVRDTNQKKTTINRRLEGIEFQTIPTTA